MSAAEDLLAWQLDQAGIGYQREFRFDAARRWRLDFALLGGGARRYAVEVEGGTWSRGRHVRGRGFADDCEKYNAAGLQGWIVLRMTTAMVESGEALKLIQQALEGALVANESIEINRAMIT